MSEMLFTVANPTQVVVVGSSERRAGLQNCESQSQSWVGQLTISLNNSKRLQYIISFGNVDMKIEWRPFLQLQMFYRSFYFAEMHHARISHLLLFCLSFVSCQSGKNINLFSVTSVLLPIIHSKRRKHFSGTWRSLWGSADSLFFTLWTSSLLRK